MTKPLSNPNLIQLRRHTEGVAVVMPAYCEEENLARTVTDFLTTLGEADVPHVVVVTNDGSTDRTGQILNRLARLYPGRVIPVHHSINQGYGAAVRSGIEAALSRTDLRWILLTDSDGQFRAADTLTFLQVQRSERADAVIGYRQERADPTVRKINAWLWTRLSRLVLGVRSRDVDCAFKLIDRSLLADVALTGEAAAISPEILAKISVDGARIVQHPVGHYPREHGEQTGARLGVIVRSLLSLVRVRLQITRRWLAWPTRRRWVTPGDPVLLLVTAAAVVLAAIAFLEMTATGAVLAYPDATSHLLIARRVLESPTNGLAQLGGVWLPLPHLLALPLVWHEALYTSGFAGSVVSMIAYVVTVRYLYRIGTTIASSRFAGVVAAGLFAANPNVLYLQSTAMTETLLFACVAAAVFHLDRWCREGGYRNLVATSFAVLLATLTRYEGWVLAVSVLAVIAYVEVRKRRPFARVEASLIFYGFVAFAGVVGWLVWNAVLFGNPLNWQNGEYADSSLWVGEADRAVGDLGIATATYWTAITLTAGTVTPLLGLGGLVAHLLRTRARPKSVGLYPLLAFGPFFVLALFTGQRPLHVPQINGDLYNVRFGLIMLLPAAIFAGYLVSLAPLLVDRGRRPAVRPTPFAAMRLLRSAVSQRRTLVGSGRRKARRTPTWRMIRPAALPRRGGAFGAVVASSVTRATGRRTALLLLQGLIAVVALAGAVAVPGVATLDEARAFRASDREAANARAAEWLRKHHDGGLTLMMSFNNESVTFDSNIDTAVIVYEGSYRLWEQALADPLGTGIVWIYMRAVPSDEDTVWQRLHASPVLDSSYELVYDADDRLIYHRKDGR